MRNLKKVLSLTLALVMMLGMMTFAGAAETKKVAFDDFKDKADITKVDAVRLMVDLGILVGDNNGYFAPKAEIERAAMAKLVYTAKMGTADAAALAGAGVFTDVTAKHWASGYINYCASTKIIAGTTDVTFAPSAKVTTAAAAKMLLVALGYDAAHQGYVGNSWAVNAMRDANKLGMLEGIDQTANQNLTRENAAQMLYNALNTLTVFNKLGYKFDGTSYVTETVTNTTTLGYEAYHMIKVEATVKAISAGKATLINPTAGVAKDYSGLLSATADMAGNKVTFFVEGKVNAAGAITSTGSLISTALMATPFTLLGKSTDGTIVFQTGAGTGDKRDLITKNGNNDTFVAELQDKDATDYNVQVFVNGEFEAVTATKTGFALGTKGVAANAKIGAIVEFYDADNNGKADIIRITDKTVDTVTGAVKMDKDATGKATVKVPGVVDSFVLTSTVVGYEGLVKDDVVLTYVVGDITYIEKAKSVEGVVTSIKGSTYKVGDTYYGVSTLTDSKGVTGFTAKDFKNTYTFYLDDNKSIVKTVKVTEETVTKTAAVLDFGTVAGSGIGGTDVFQAKLMMEDGTTQIVPITKWNALKIIADPTPEEDKSEPTAKEEIYYKNAATAANNLNVADNKNVLVSYKIDKNSKYELTPIETAKIAAKTEIKTDTAKFDGAHIANSKTVFLVQKGAAGSEVYAVYTGIAKLPAIAKDKLTIGSVVVGTDKIATYVFLNTSEVTGDTSSAKIAYILDVVNYDTVSDGDTGAHYVFQAVVDGVKTTLKTTTVAHIATPGATTGFITYKTVDGIITSAATAVTPGANITIAAGGTLVLGTKYTIDKVDKTEFLYDADTVVVVIDGKNVSTISGDDITIDDNDTVVVQLVSGTTNDTAAFITIVKVAP